MVPKYITGLRLTTIVKPRKGSGKVTKKGKSKRQAKASRSVGSIAKKTKKLLKSPYKRGARQIMQSPAVKEILKIASNSDDIEQLTLDIANRTLSASSNLSLISTDEKLAAAEDVRNILKKRIKDGAAAWISDFTKAKKVKNKKNAAT